MKKSKILDATPRGVFYDKISPSGRNDRIISYLYIRVYLVPGLRPGTLQPGSAGIHKSRNNILIARDFLIPCVKMKPGLEIPGHFPFRDMNP